MKKNTIALGLLRGDEGKGKIVDYLSDSHDIIIRFQGGPNAGHTIYRGTVKVVLHQIPSGILNDKECLIGHGCIIDPKKLINEINQLQTSNLVSIDKLKNNLKIAKNCHIITKEHIEQDTLRENTGKGNGSTKCGISPCYRDKYYRTGKRLMDIFVKPTNTTNEFDLVKFNNIKENTCKEFEITKEQYDLICDLLIDDTYYLNYMCKDKSLLFEGAQGVFLDIDNLYYPNVSSSHVNVGGVIAGTGINFNTLKTNTQVVGIIKSYMSSVGVGYFITEIKDKIQLSTGIYDANILRDVGQEYGATTGRPRKVGFLDLPMIKYACDTIGVTNLCLTRLDTLYDWLVKNNQKYIPVCVDYAKVNASSIVPTEYIDWSNTSQYRPIYKMFKLWEKPHDDNFNTFIKYIEHYTNTPITYISLGKGKNELYVNTETNYFKNDTIIVSTTNI